MLVPGALKCPFASSTLLLSNARLGSECFSPFQMERTWAWHPQAERQAQLSLHQCLYTHPQCRITSQILCL